MKKWLIALSLLLVASLGLPACGSSDKKSKPPTYTIGLLNSGATGTPILDGFKEGMTELGYTEGTNVTYVLEQPDDPAQLNDAAQRLVDGNVDLILCVGRIEAQAAQSVTTAVPIVFAASSDPVAEGLVKSLAQPGENMTGMVMPNVQRKRLALLLQIDPSIHKVYIPFDSSDLVAVNGIEDLSELAPSLGAEIVRADVTDLDTAQQAIATMPADVDAIFLGVSRPVLALTANWIVLSVVRKIPISWPLGSLPNPNVLMGYGPGLFQSGKQAASQVDKILKGAKPGDLPVVPLDYYLTISMPAAATLGIHVPDTVLNIADNIIYPDTNGSQ